MHKYRQWARRFLLVAAGSLLLVALVNIVIDPLQQYRQASFYTPVYKSTRYLNPGLAKTHAYDTAILGSSMIDNCRPSYMNQVLGGTSIKLPLSGGSSHEIATTLQVVLNRPEVKRVIIGIDLFSFKGDQQRLANGPGSLPLYLYDNNLLNDIQYLLSLDTLDHYRSLLHNKFSKKKKKYPTTYDDYKYWGNRANFGEETVWQQWQRGQFNTGCRISDFDFVTLKNSFDYNLLSLFQKAPQVTFEIFFPPYSPLAWVDMANKSILNDSLAFKRYIVSAVQTLDNVKVFDFQDVAEITHNLNNYKDITHYRPEINDAIIDAIAADQFRVDATTIDQHIKQLLTQLEVFILRYPQHLGVVELPTQ
ncbi:MAG: hypothetical protein KAU22_06020 [Desulfuromonadales bacterium]|nr:hypothetical protein [Desulfuromonadales bacterium]